MKNQHTPGPWRVVCASAHEFNPNTTRKDIIGKNLFGDAYVAGDIAANDAALIAAAPELLQIAKDYVLLCQLHDLEGAVLDSARAAIAKAEGVK